MPSEKQALAKKYRTALVTGASSGIGRAIANALLKEGLRVIGTSRQPDRPSLPQDIHWIPFDGASIEGIHQCIREFPGMFSEVDLLVNSAGQSCFGRVDAVPREAISGLHHLLLEAPVQLTRAVLPGMRERGGGAIVNISSLAALFPMPYMPSYSAGKAGLSTFSRSLMLTERANGIVVIDFQAGDFRTEFNNHVSRHGNPDPSQQRVWERLEACLAISPFPETAARDVLRALRKGRSATVRSGGFFQKTLAPLGLRFLPDSLLLACIRRYFRIPPR